MPRQFSKYDLSRLLDDATQSPRETLGLKLTLIKTAANVVNSTYETHADDIISTEKRSKKRKAPFIKTSRRQRSYIYKIVTDALPAAIDQDHHTGVIQALVLKGGDSSCIKNDQTASDLESSRAYLLLKAVSSQNLDTITLFACSPHNARLNDALSQALETRRPELVRRLLEHGADPNHCRDQIAALALEGNTLLLTFLRRAPVAITAGVAFDSLVNAVQSGCIKTVILLAEIAGLEECEDVPALSEALRILRCDMVLTILSQCSGLLRAESLDRFVFDICESTTIDLATKCQFIDILLYAGADGSSTCAAFTMAVERNIDGIIELFIKHKIDINWAEAKAACFAARAGNSQLLMRVMEAGTLSTDSASRVIDALARNMPATERTIMLQKLLRAGASGPAVDKALVYAIQDDRIQDVRFLRGRGALIGCKGSALIEVIKCENLDMMSFLLEGPVEPISMQHAFPYLRKAAKETRYEMTRMLLEKGACGAPVSVALQEAVCDQTKERDERLIELLLKHGADPAFERSKSFRHVVSRSDLKTFSSLLRSSSKLSYSSASEIVTDVSMQEDVEIRYSFYQEMITSGVPKASVAHALCLELEMSDSNKSILELLLRTGNADLTYNNGRALELAAMKDDEEILRLVTESSSKTSTVTRAAVLSVINSTMFDDEAKLSRLNCLLVCAQPPLAYEGILAQVRSCMQKNIAGRDWPLSIFSLLLSHKPNINTNGGELLREALTRGAIPLLNLLLQLSPSQVVLDAALQSCMTVSNEQDCMDACTRIIQSHPSAKGISAALLTACQGLVSLSICKMLLDHGADLNFNNGAIIVQAVSNANMPLLQFILTSKPSQHTLALAFEHAIRHSDPRACYDLLHEILSAGFRGQALYDFVVKLVQAPRTNCQLLQLCIDHDALSHARDSICAIHATLSHKLDVLQVLAPKAFSPAVADACLRASMDQKILLTCHSDLLDFLLKQGAKGPPLADALLMVTTDSAVKNVLTKAELLLKYGADVNALNGEILSRACALGNVQLVSMLVQARSSMEIRSRALHALVSSDVRVVPSATFCTLLGILTDKRQCSQERATFAYCQLNFRHALRVLLSLRPRGKEELLAVLDTEPGLLQCPRVPSKLLPGRVAGADVPDLLHWALTETSPRIETSLLSILISKGANTRHITNTGESMVMVAIQTGRSKLIEPLRARGTDLSCKDSKGRSPLLYAVEQEKSDAVEALAPHVVPDDGSLHQAVRKFNPTLVRLLLDHGHDATMPSPYIGHSKTTPLMELLAIDVDPSQHHIFKEILSLLLSRGADVTKKIDNKPLICVALDRGYAVTDAVLAAGLRLRIDEDFNIYNDGTYCYSPTWYVSKKLNTSNENRVKLVALLRTYGAQSEVFYKLEGVQPSDAVGMPPQIERLERERRNKRQREQERQEALEREQLRAEQTQEHQMRLEQKRQDHTLALRADAAAREAELVNNRHTTALTHSREAFAEEEHQREATASARSRERTAELFYEQERARIEMQSTKEWQELDLSHRQAILDAERDAVEEGMRQGRRMAEGVNWVREREHRRVMERERFAEERDRFMERKGPEMGAGIPYFGTDEGGRGYGTGPRLGIEGGRRSGMGLIGKGRTASVYTLPSSLVGEEGALAIVPRKPLRR